MADIELVIKIPEEIYKASQILDVKYEDTIQIPLKVIANGTPLPKHGRLIDAGEFVDVLNNAQIEGLNTYKGIGRAKELLIDAPTIIEADKAESEK